ncbi:MAG: hypothetical protein Q4G02_02055 [bacterium]|nr:hypothetical protein [bacterium]
MLKTQSLNLKIIFCLIIFNFLIFPLSVNANTKINISAPLRCVPSSSDGTVCDYIDFKNQQVVRNIGVKVFDGTEAFGFYSDATTNRIMFRTAEPSMTAVSYTEQLSSHFHYYSSWWTVVPVANLPAMAESMGDTAEFSFIFPDTGNITTVNDFTSWLAAQAAAGTPVTVQYQLATPTYEYFDVENLIPKFTGGTQNGITLTVADDGTLTLNGTATAQTEFYVGNTITSLFNPDTYTLSLNNTSVNNNVRFIIDSPHATPYYAPFYLYCTTTTLTSTLTTTQNLTRALIIINNGATVDNFTLKPQLEVGSIAHPYVPYGSPIAPLPKVETASGSASLWATDGNLQSSNLQVHYWQE